MKKRQERFFFWIFAMKRENYRIPAGLGFTRRPHIHVFSGERV